MFAFTGTRPSNLGVRDGRLNSCPDTPNCVCSQDLDAAHKIEPLTYSTSQSAAFDALKKLIEAWERAEIVTATEDYLHAEFSSKLMGFVDDVEFYLDPSANVIQVRSAARLGKSDLGVNRKRIELIRTRLKETGV